MQGGDVETDPIEPGSRVDDFDVLEKLGSGAFAEVYLARQRSMQRLVALKVASRQSREPQTMAQLDHANIVRVFDERLIREGRVRLLYMEYVRGGTLQAAVDLARRIAPAQRSGRLLLENLASGDLRRSDRLLPEGLDRARLAAMSWPQLVCWLGAQLAEALDYAHRRGVLHRDLKPANVLLTEDAVPKLADFNIASAQLDGDAPPAAFGGSLAYMSPEQLEAGDSQHPRRPEGIDGRSDLYSLGVLLWELLAGRRPFADDVSSGSLTSVVRQMAGRRRLGIPDEVWIELPPDTPTALRDVLRRCLAPDPKDRPQTGRQLARQLRLAQHPRVQQLLWPESDGFGELIRRHPLLAMAAACVVPNLLLSAFNIHYNGAAIVAQLNQSARQLFFGLLLGLVNVVLYGLGCGLGAAMAWPVWKAVRGGPAGRDVVARCLRLGDWLFWIVAVCWALAGVAFPVCLRISGADLTFSDGVHFFASHLLCGLIAGTLTFFLLSLVDVRFVCPRLLARETTPPPGQGEHLRALDRRIGIYSRLAASIPFAAAILLGFIAPGFRDAFLGLAAAGAGVLAVSFGVTRALQADLKALELAASPSGTIPDAAPH